MGIMDTREKVVHDSVSSLTDEFNIIVKRDTVSLIIIKQINTASHICYVVKQTLNIKDIKTHSRETYIVFENK